jgi:enamine deaminase RidA (YjgF/YER057c/UK114 family)
MRTKIIQPHGLVRGRGYSNGAMAGGMLAVAGQIGWDQTGRLVSAELPGQFEQALANLVSVVRGAGLSPVNVIQVRIYVTDRREYAAATRELGESWRRHMGRHYPAMSLIEVKGLLEDGAKVEIEALAVRT